jgi:predicted small secreted protein
MSNVVRTVGEDVKELGQVVSDKAAEMDAKVRLDR